MVRIWATDDSDEYLLHVWVIVYCHVSTQALPLHSSESQYNLNKIKTVSLTVCKVTSVILVKSLETTQAVWL